MPDLGVVLRDGAVGAEIARPGDVGEHLFGPGGAVLIPGQGAGFGGDVVLDVEQRHEPVFVLHVLPQRVQRRRVPDGEQRGREQEIHQILDAGAVVVVQRAVAPAGVEVDDRIAGRAEGVDVVRPDELRDLPVSPRRWP